MLRRQLIHHSRSRLLAKTPLLPAVFSSSSISSSAAPTIIIHYRTSFSHSKLLLTEETTATSKPTASSSKTVVIKAVSSILVDGANFISTVSSNTIAFELLKESIQKYLESKLREAYEEDNPDENCSGLKVRVIFPPSSLHVVFPDPVDGLDKQAIDETEFIKRLKFHRDLESAGWMITLAKYKKTETSKWKAIEDDVVLANKASEISRQGYFAPIGASSKRATAEHLFIVTGDGDHLSTVKDANSNNDENSEHHSEKRALRYVVLCTKRKSSCALIRYGESVDRIHRLYDDEEFDRAVDELRIRQPSGKRDREPKSTEKKPEEVLLQRREAAGVATKEEPKLEIAKDEPKPEIVAKLKSSSSVASSILELLESEEETSKEQQQNTSTKSSLAAIVEDEPPTTPAKSNRPTPPVVPAPPVRSSSPKEKEKKSSSSLPFSLNEAANYYLNPHVTKPARAMKLEALAPSFYENVICLDDKTRVGCRRKNCQFVHPSRGETRLGDKICKGDEDYVKSEKRSTCMCKYVHRSRGEKTLTELQEERTKQKEEKKEDGDSALSSSSPAKTENNNNDRSLMSPDGYLRIDLARHAPFYTPKVPKKFWEKKRNVLDPTNIKNILCAVDLEGRKCPKLPNCKFVHLTTSKGSIRVGDIICKTSLSSTNGGKKPSACPCPFVHRDRGEKTLSELEKDESKLPIKSTDIENSSIKLLDDRNQKELDLQHAAKFYFNECVSFSERNAKLRMLDGVAAENYICRRDRDVGGCQKDRCNFVHPSRGDMRKGDKLCPSDEHFKKRGQESKCRCKYVHRSRGEKTLTELEEERTKHTGEKKEGEQAAQPSSSTSTNIIKNNNNNNKDYLRVDLKRHAPFYTEKNRSIRDRKMQLLDPTNRKNVLCETDLSGARCTDLKCEFVHSRMRPNASRVGDLLCQVENNGKCACSFVHRSRGEKTLSELEKEEAKRPITSSQIENGAIALGDSHIATFRSTDVASFYVTRHVSAAERSEKNKNIDPLSVRNLTCPSDKSKKGCKRSICRFVHPSRGEERAGDKLCPLDVQFQKNGTQSKCTCPYVHRSRGEKTLKELEEERRKQQEQEKNEKVKSKEQQQQNKTSIIREPYKMLFGFDANSIYLNHRSPIRKAKLNAMDPSFPNNVICDCDEPKCEYVHPHRGEIRAGDKICSQDVNSIRKNRTGNCSCKYVHRSRGEKTLSELEEEDRSRNEKKQRANLRDVFSSSQEKVEPKATNQSAKEKDIWEQVASGEDNAPPTTPSSNQLTASSSSTTKDIGEQTAKELQKQPLPVKTSSSSSSSSPTTNETAPNEGKNFFDIDEVAPFYKNRATLVRRAKEKMLDPTVHANILCKCKLANCAFVHQDRGQKRAGDKICPADQNFTRRNQKSNCPCKFVHPSRGEKTLTELEEERAEKQQTTLAVKSLLPPASSEASSTTKDLEQSAQEQHLTLVNKTGHQDVISSASSPSPSSQFEIQRVASFYVSPGVPKRVRQEKRQALDPENPKNKFCRDDRTCTDNSCMFVHPSKGEQRAGDLICENDVYNQEKGLSSKCRCPKVHRSRNEKTLTELEQEVETQKQDRIRDPNHTKNMVCRYDHQPGGCSRPDCHFAHPKSKAEERAGDIICPNESKLGKDEISSCSCSFVHRTRGEKTLTETESLYSPSTIVEVILTSVEGDRVLERINVSYSSLPHIFKIRYARGETIYVCSNYYNFGDCAWAKCCYLHITREDAEEGKLVVVDDNTNKNSGIIGNSDSGALSHDKLVTVVYTGDDENNNNVRYFTVPLWSLSKDARVRHNLNERLEICTHYFNTGECPHRDCKFIHMSLKSDEKNGTPSLTSSPKEKVGRPTVINTSNDDDRIAQRKAEAFLAGKVVSVALPGSSSPGQDFDSKSRILRYIPVPFSELPPHCQSRFLNEKSITACHQFYHTGECVDKKCSYLHIKTAIEQNDEVEKELIFLASNLDKRSLVKVHENILKVKD